jgi:hypothetical protein
MKLAVLLFTFGAVSLASRCLGGVLYEVVDVSSTTTLPLVSGASQGNNSGYATVNYQLYWKQGYVGETPPTSILEHITANATCSCSDSVVDEIGVSWVFAMSANVSGFLVAGAADGHQGSTSDLYTSPLGVAYKKSQSSIGVSWTLVGTDSAGLQYYKSAQLIQVVTPKVTNMGYAIMEGSGIAGNGSEFAGFGESVVFTLS